MSGLSTVVCAIVANYETLLLSRALIGFCVGLNLWIHSVMIVELVSSNEIVGTIVTISKLMYTVGGVWPAVLGYLLLDVVGWRVFILLISLPTIIPPIFMLHFCFSGTAGPNIQFEQDGAVHSETVGVPNMIARVTKLGLCRALSMFQGWLTILLVPTLIQLIKTRNTELESGCTETATQGAELLILALVTFAALPGKLFASFLKDRVHYRKSQVIVAMLNIGTFAAMSLQESIVVVTVTNFIVKFLYGISNMATYYIFIDKEYFGTDNFALASSVANAIGLVGGVAGTAVVAFAPTLYVIITALVLSALQILVVLSMTDVR